MSIIESIWMESRLVQWLRNGLAIKSAAAAIRSGHTCLRTVLYWHMPSWLQGRISVTAFAEYFLGRNAAKYLKTLLPSDPSIVVGRTAHPTLLRQMLVDHVVTSTYDPSSISRSLTLQPYVALSVSERFFQSPVGLQTESIILRLFQRRVVQKDWLGPLAIATCLGTAAYFLLHLNRRKPNSQRREPMLEERLTAAGRKLYAKILPRLRRQAAFTSKTPDTEQSVKTTMESLFRDEEFNEWVDEVTEEDLEIILHLAMRGAMVPSKMELDTMDHLEENNSLLWKAHRHVRNGWTDKWAWLMGKSVPK